VGSFTMIAFGGGAPLHAARVAAKLGMRHVLVPAGAGVGSAIGFLRAPMAYEVVRSRLGRLRGTATAAIDALLAEMETQARAVVEPAARGAGQPVHELSVQRLAELRYQGQGHELRVGVPAGRFDNACIERMQTDFEAAYQRTYGVRMSGAEIEAVTWSVTVSTAAAPVVPARLAAASDASTAQPTDTRAVWDPITGRDETYATYWRFDLAPGARLDGPALVIEHETTTLVPAGWSVLVDSAHHLHLLVHPHAAPAARAIEETARTA
jgi:N-methylhydantoinase A